MFHKPLEKKKKEKASFMNAKGSINLIENHLATCICSQNIHKFYNQYKIGQHPIRKLYVALSFLPVASEFTVNFNR